MCSGTVRLHFPDAGTLSGSSMAIRFYPLFNLVHILARVHEFPSTAAAQEKVQDWEDGRMQPVWVFLF